MTKKVFLVLCLCVLIVSGAFAAGRFSLVGQLSPYAFQSVKHTSGTYKSTYGYGATVGARYEVLDNVNVGLDVDLTFYKYGELSTNYVVVSAKAVGGYTYKFADKFFAQGELRVGVDERIIGSSHGMYFGCGVKLNAGYIISDAFKVTAGASVDLGFQKGKETKSTDFDVRPSVGVIYAL